MPIQELDITFGSAHGLGEPDEELQIFQKKVDLSSGMRHTMMSVDVFDDSMILHQFAGDVMIELFVSPQPIIYSEMAFGPQNNYANRGPQAAEENILYKSIFLKEGNSFKVDEFPNETLGAMPTFTWYSPQLYITMLVHSLTPQAVPPNLALSLYMVVKEDKATNIEYGIGMIQEVLSAQTRDYTIDMYSIKSSLNVGLSFPSWKFGGIRPEYMLTANNLSDFWLNNNSQETELMITDANMDIYIGNARTMVPYDQAFGRIDSTKGAIPDWIKMGNMGFADFKLRSNFPPTLKTDAGITRML